MSQQRNIYFSITRQFNTKIYWRVTQTYLKNVVTAREKEESDIKYERPGI